MRSSTASTSERRSLLIFDGECRFCRASVKLIGRIVGSEHVRAVPSQTLTDATLAGFHVTRAECSDYVILVAADTRVYRGASAINAALSQSRALARAGPIVGKIPFAFRLEDAAYRFISRHRSSVSVVVFGVAHLTARAFFVVRRRARRGD